VCVCAQSSHTKLTQHDLWIIDVAVAVFYWRISDLVMLIDWSSKLHVEAVISLHYWRSFLPLGHRAPPRRLAAQVTAKETSGRGTRGPANNRTINHKVLNIIRDNRRKQFYL